MILVTMTSTLITFALLSGKKRICIICIGSL